MGTVERVPEPMHAMTGRSTLKNQSEHLSLMSGARPCPTYMRQIDLRGKGHDDNYGDNYAADNQGCLDIFIHNLPLPLNVFTPVLLIYLKEEKESCQVHEILK